MRLKELKKPLLVAVAIVVLIAVIVLIGQRPPIHEGVNVRGRLIVGYSDGTEEVFPTGTAYSIFRGDRKIDWLMWEPDIMVMTTWKPQSIEQASIKIERWLYFDDVCVEGVTPECQYSEDIVTETKDIIRPNCYRLDPQTEVISGCTYTTLETKIVAYEFHPNHPQMADLSEGTHSIKTKWRLTVSATGPDGKTITKTWESSPLWETTITKTAYDLIIDVQPGVAFCGNGICEDPLETTTNCADDC